MTLRAAFIRAFQAHRLVRWAFLLLTLLLVPLAPAQDPPDDLNVRAVLETDPTTPAELVRAIGVLIDLKRAAAAKPLVAKLQAANLDDAACAALVAQFGSAEFLKLARARDLLPEGRAVAEAIVAGSNRHLRDPAQIDALIKQLGDPSLGIQALAVEQLRLVGPEVVSPLLATLTDPNQAAAHAGARRTILRLGSEAIGPLQGALESNDAPLIAEAASALAQLRALQSVNDLLGLAYGADLDERIREAAHTALAQLLGQAPSRAAAAAWLDREAVAYLTGTVDLPRGELSLDPQRPGRVIKLWHWDAERRASVAREYSPPAARNAIAAELARNAFRLTAPADPYYANRRVRYIVTALAELPLGDKANLGRVLPPSVFKLGNEPGHRLWLDSLNYALTAGQWRAANHLINLLADTGDERVLAGDGRPSPLAAGLACPERSVRLAALAAIARLKPRTPFVGASLVPITIAAFLDTASAPRAVVAAGDEEAGRLAGLLSALGYEAEGVASGQALFKAARASADVELIVIDSAVIDPPPIDCIVKLRQDPRTMLTPIALVISVGEEDRFLDRLRGDLLTDLFVRPQDPAGFAFQIERLRGAGLSALAPQDRIDHARAAAGHLVALGHSSPRLFDFLPLVEPLTHAIYLPGVTADAARALVGIGSPEAQTVLVDYASGPTQQLADRQAAAQAFCDSVRRWGILLTTSQLAAQYDRYNQSETLDEDTQQLLSSILDCLEAGRGSHPPAVAPATPTPKPNPANTTPDADNQAVPAATQ